jgi:hypothetical protein
MALNRFHNRGKYQPLHETGYTLRVHFEIRETPCTVRYCPRAIFMHIDTFIRPSVGASAKRSAYQYFAPTADYGLKENNPDTRRAFSEAKRSAYQYFVATADLSAPRAPSNIQGKNLKLIIGLLCPIEYPGKNLIIGLLAVRLCCPAPSMLLNQIIHRNLKSA